MSLQQEERQPGKRETAWVLETGWHSVRLGVRVEGGGPAVEGEGWTFITVTGLQVAVLGQGCKGALSSWSSLCSLDGDTLVGVWLGAKKGCLVVLPSKPRP